MQVTAIVEARSTAAKKKIQAIVEIMIPLVGSAKELALLRELRGGDHCRGRRRKKYSGKLDITIGTMIEIPARPCGRRDRRGRRLLQLRHERPHAADLRVQP
jgi:phosphoenolpyruvate synthase/pyruvate phosphate dikinase